MFRKKMFFVAMSAALLLSASVAIAQDEAQVEAADAQSAEVVEQPAAVAEPQPVAVQPPAPAAPAAQQQAAPSVPASRRSAPAVLSVGSNRRGQNQRVIEFFAAPDPVDRQDGEPVIIFVEGETATHWALSVHDPRGQRIFRINSESPTARWDLINDRGNTVNAGRYEIRGTVTLSNDRRETIQSLLVRVR